MQKLAVALVISLFLLVSIGTAADFDLTKTRNLTDIADDSLQERLKAWQISNASNEWIVVYRDSSGANDAGYMYFEHFDSTFYQTNITSGVFCQDAAEGLNASDCNWFVAEDGSDNIECIGRNNDGGFASGSSCMWRYFPTNNSFSIFETDSPSASEGRPLSPGVINDYYDSNTDKAFKVWRRFTNAQTGEANLRYTLTDDWGTQIQGDGTITLPVLYQSPDDVQLAYCGGHYHLFLLNDGEITDSIYRRNILTGLPSPNIHTQSLSETGFDQVAIDDWSIWVDYPNNQIYFSQINQTVETPQINYQVWDCDPVTGLISQQKSQIEDITTIETTANTSLNVTISKPYFTYDGGEARLFYQFENNGDYQIKTSSACYCSPFIPSGECYVGEEKFTRSCIPSGCETNLTDWRPTAYCEGEWNRDIDNTTQGSTPWAGVGSCQGDVIEFGNGISECSPTPVEIPSDCYNITVTEKAVGVFDWSEGLTGGLKPGNFTMKACTPPTITHCTIDTFSCEEVNDANANVTVTHTQSDYFAAGDTATGYSNLIVNPECIRSSVDPPLGSRFYNPLSKGIGDYHVVEFLEVTCDRLCKEEYVCKEALDGTEYEIQIMVNCLQNATSKADCDYGCDSANGRCKARPTLGSEDRAGSLPWILACINAPTRSQKIIIGVTGSLVFAAIITGLIVQVNSLKDAALPTFMISFGAGILFSIAVGFISAIVLVVIVAGVGVMFVLKNLK